MAQKLEALKAEVDQRFEDIMENINSNKEESNLYAKSLQDTQMEEIKGLEQRMKIEIEFGINIAISELKKNMDSQYEGIIKLIKDLQVSTSSAIPSGAGTSPSSGASIVSANEFVKSSYWVKIIGSTSIDVAWNSIPEIITKNGKKFKGPKRWMLLEEYVFADSAKMGRCVYGFGLGLGLKDLRALATATATATGTADGCHK